MPSVVLSTGSNSFANEPMTQRRVGCATCAAVTDDAQIKNRQPFIFQFGSCNRF